MRVQRRRRDVGGRRGILRDISGVRLRVGDAGAGFGELPLISLTQRVPRPNGLRSTAFLSRFYYDARAQMCSATCL